MECGDNSVQNHGLKIWQTIFIDVDFWGSVAIDIKRLPLT